MKYLYINKETKQIVLESEKKMDLKQFDIKEVDDNEELTGNQCHLIDDKIVKEPIKKTISKKKIEEEIENAKDVDGLKEILKKHLK